MVALCGVAIAPEAGNFIYPLVWTWLHDLVDPPWGHDVMSHLQCVFPLLLVPACELGRHPGQPW